MNPTPVTTWPAMRVGLESWVIRSATNTYVADPRQTNALVCNPAGCLRSCLSKPTAVPSNSASKRLKIACVIVGVMVKLVSRTIPLTITVERCMHATSKAILDYNKGRDPERLRLKLQALRRDPFSFFRGTAPLFYKTLAMPKSLLGAPKVLASGDLHLENFGSYKADNRLIYFDLSDFDEACVAPLTFEVARFLASILVGAEYLKIGEKKADSLLATFMDAYTPALVTTKPRWVERATAIGPVKGLMQSLKNRHRIDLIERRTERKKGKVQIIADGEHALPASANDKARAESILSAYASTQPSPTFFDPIAIARRIAGNGSMGLERYVVLVRGTGPAEGRYLIDIKFANPSALATAIKIDQPAWRSEGERVVWVQRITQAIPPALLGAVGVGNRSYVIKELQPTTDRVNLRALDGKQKALTDVVRTMAEVAAWGHLRGASRFGVDSADALAQFASKTPWRKEIVQLSRKSAKVALQQWKEYSVDYDKDIKK